MKFLSISVSIGRVEFKARRIFDAHIVKLFMDIVNIVFFNDQSILVLSPFKLPNEALASVLNIVGKEAIAHSLQSLRLVKLRAQFVLDVYKILASLIFSVL